VRFDHVSFAYGTGDGPLAVDSVDLELPIGTVTALTGRSGSGKSTLALLLARFHDPTAGRVLIRGRDLREIPPDELYRTVSFVLQEPQLLRASIRDNVRLAVPDAPDDVIWAQLEKACVADEVRALPHGLDTVFGDEADLSGGQKQRLQIARALLADAPVLILDEATSATDPDSEAEIQRALSSLAEGRTVLVIAHRPESVCGADQVIRLDQGRITRTLTGAEATDAAIRELMTAGSTDEEGGAR
jgi:ATP-binding cassette subfamily B protein